VYVSLNDGDLYAALPHDGEVSRAIAEAGLVRKISPLDILLQTMRARWREGQVEGAINLAKIAAPYVHPRPHERGADGAISNMRDEQLDELCGDGAGGESAAPEIADDPG